MNSKTLLETLLKDESIFPDSANIEKNYEIQASCPLVHKRRG
jgi:hypothetical protein